ncbi:hypothetical protein BGZ60DRAFT_364078 [Tricladium varicosporioides]|nr:hypothetical protein BGZ60DRAFT_364078 [Hymenoscyphus varicosporioides]
MGVTNYSPENWDNIEVLSPEEFHERCYRESNILLVDTRNHYESRIGYFINPKTREPALRPLIRRFSQWPQYVREYMARPESNQTGQTSQEGRQIITFCTGGIRCEKGARYMEEKMTKRPGDRVCTLKGGIANYITWMDEEISKGRKLPEDSLFKGRNYVFDARGSIGLEGTTEPVSKCHECSAPSARLSKCRSKGCHLVLVICQTCEDSEDPRCCKSCLELDIAALATKNLESRVGSRPICLCEMDRETQLWGERTAKVPKAQKSRAEKDRFLQGSSNINIQVATFS